MSVIMRGMEMPAMCSDCPFNSGMCLPKGEYYCECPSRNIQGSKITRAMDEDCRHPDCPLVELPEKHGRLIDADFVIEKASYEAKAMDEPFKSNFDVLVEWIVDKTPTVIEAEGSEYG